MMTKPPIGLWIANAIIGGVLGALNPTIQRLLFDQGGFNETVSRYGESIPTWAMVEGVFFLLLLFPACLCSTAVVYPMLYRKIVTALAKRPSLGLGVLLKLTLIYGFLVTMATAVLFTANAILFGLLSGKDIDIVSALGALLASLPVLGGTAFVMFFPIIMIVGFLFVWANAVFIRKYFIK